MNASRGADSFRRPPSRGERISINLKQTGMKKTDKAKRPAKGKKLQLKKETIGDLSPLKSKAAAVKGGRACPAASCEAT
jgi:hypothetical protein